MQKPWPAVFFTMPGNKESDCAFLQKNHIMNKHTLLSLLIGILTASLLSISCTKEPEPEPEPTFMPLEANNYTYGTDSAAITKVVLTYYEGQYTYSFSSGQEYIVNISTPTITQNTQDLSACQAYIYYNGTSQPLQSGTFTCKKIGSNYEITINGMTSNTHLKLYYYGPLLNTTSPNGSGQLTVGNLNIPLNMLYSEFAYDSYSYVFTDTAASFTATFYSTYPLTDRTYSITPDDSALEADGSVLLYVEGEHQGQYIFGVAESGTFTLSHHDNTYDATFSGLLIDENTGLPMDFSGTFSGQLLNI